MALIRRSTPKERETKRAEESARVHEQIRQERIQRKVQRVADQGYNAEDGRVDGKGGYGVTIHDNGIVSAGDRELGDYLEGPLVGMRASLETLEQARSRVTVTRLIALGVLAFAVKKHDHRRVLALTGADGFEAVLIVDSSDEVHLRRWVAWFNRQAGLAEKNADQTAEGDSPSA